MQEHEPIEDDGVEVPIIVVVLVVDQDDPRVAPVVRSVDEATAV